MTSVIEMPVCIDESDKVASLEDVLGTLKVAYTIVACTHCGRMVMLDELTAPAVREPVLA
ncbi:MAG: hypothetical protein JO020_20220 [Chloroflexi bacterium]|nr:hypothetical protein [Chloroflexota bacterium]MBV9132064.1 hypothetical protein [Chloroflexota bacterium]MBV9896499.1 hypothetical protein [Chloroflexota bacterium]